jgi:hypothetical protein
MQYFKIAGKTGWFVELNDVTNRVSIVVKADLLQQKAELVARIGAPDPGQPATNAEWVTWAKAHYPYMDHSAEQAELTRIETIIAAIKDL